LDRLFCHDLKNGIGNVKRNRIRNGILQQTEAGERRLPKDGELIGNND
jgi:hypothetical protein